MRRARMQILVSTVVRRKDDGDYISHGVRVIYSIENEQHTGVALLLLECSVAECVNSIERHGDRIWLSN